MNHADKKMYIKYIEMAKAEVFIVYSMTAVEAKRNMNIMKIFNFSGCVLFEFFCLASC